jgi:hypothetical protein
VKTRFVDYEWATAGLIGGAVLFVSVGILTNRGDLTSATLVLSGVACFVAGLYLFTFTRGEPFDSRIAALLPVQGSIEVCTLCADLGAGGNGYVLPSPTGSLLHFIPVGEFRSPALSEDRTFLIDGDGGHGITLTPAGQPLLTLLEKEYHLNIPREEAGLLSLLEEVGQEVFSLAETVTAVRSGENMVVTLNRYRLIDGCRTMQRASPRCCSIYPCPVCSLFSCLLSQGTGKAITLDQAVLEGPNLRLVYSAVS